jgi:DNA-binding NarL/FixJ family response regulator
MKALIVDDEPIARRVLREGLESFPEVQVVGEAGDGREALQEMPNY